MTTPTHGSLFTGYGGLDLAIEEVFGARTVWNSDIEPGPRKVLAHRFPDVPNLGDITTVDWSKVEPVDIIAGGSPCQDISTAGRRAGMTDGTRSNLWVAMRDAIASLQPRYVIWENVRGALSTRAASAMESDPRLLGDHRHGVPVLRALGRVLGDLADLGYDAIWHGLRAADIGAPHGRFRIFVVAANAAHVRHERPWPSRVGWAGPADRGVGPVTLLPTPSAGNFNYGEDPDQWEARRQRVKETANNGNGMGMPLGIAVKLLPTPKASNNEKRPSLGYGMNLGQALGVTPLLPTPSVADSTGGHERRGGKRGDELLPPETPLAGGPGGADGSESPWGPYAAAIHRWEQVLGRPAPSPTKPGRNGSPKLNPAFVEFMMGAPAGWITNTPGVTDNEALRMAGNGVVRQQAVAALRLMLNRMEVAA